VKFSLEKLLAACDDQQREAIESEQQPLLVMASAGSGKTRVLTYRIYHRAVLQKAALSHMLAITFTRKAATNMKTRLITFGLPNTITVGTFHAVALSCVKDYYADKRRSPKILTNKMSLLAEILAKYPDLDMTLSASSSYNQKTSGVRNRKVYSTTQYMRALEQELDLIASNTISSDTDPTAALRQSQNPHIPRHVIDSVFKLYREEKRKRFLLDFDDLVVHLGDLIKSDTEFGDLMRWKYRHVFVDEVQDMTLAQLNLLKVMLGDNNDLFGVGDTRQSIYEWNGAVNNIEVTFKTYFPDTHTINLSTNYRSTPQIVNVASSLIDGLRISSKQESGPLPTVTSYQDADSEALGIARAIRSMKFKVAGYHEIAVLVRTNAQCELIADALEKLGLPVKKNVLASLSLLRDLAVEFTDSAAGLQMMLRDMEMLLTEISKRSAFDYDFQGDEDISEGKDIYENISLTFPNLNREQIKGQELKIIDNMHVLYNLGKDYIEFEANPNISGFSYWVSLLRKNDVADGESGVVQVLTFHKAKGLEWKIVFLAGLEEGLVPIQGALQRDALAEERRLLYVAMTRATHELHLSYALRRSHTESQRLKSRWLLDIEKAIQKQRALDTLTPEEIKKVFQDTKQLLKRDPY
jgi:DNA helicase-2/ATP-dependent DNA helicase PcrA